MAAHPRRRVQGLDVLYRKAGDPAAPTLVLLHGYPSSSFMSASRSRRWKTSCI